ncbi:Uncharacterised protein [Bordetella pertussis]|nr:Uncharacterised protein [Bordetella pertussis]
MVARGRARPARASWPVSCHVRDAPGRAQPLREGITDRLSEAAALPCLGEARVPGFSSSERATRAGVMPCRIRALTFSSAGLSAK